MRDTKKVPRRRAHNVIIKARSHPLRSMTGARYARDQVTLRNVRLPVRSKKRSLLSLYAGTKAAHCMVKAAATATAKRGAPATRVLP